MIAILVSCLLFVFGLICTIPPRKIKFLPQYFHFNHNYNDHKKPSTETSTNAPVLSFNTSRRMKSSCCRVELRDVFSTFDKNNDGFITRQELKEFLKNTGINAGEKDVADMVEKVDANGDGLIDLDEFCKLFDTISDDGELREAFDVFDGNKDGMISVDELGLVLSSLGFTEGKQMEDCKEMIRKVDMDGDGKVNFDEFKEMMKEGLKGVIPLSSK